jgi:hypothetical protein
MPGGHGKRIATAALARAARWVIAEELAQKIRRDRCQRMCGIGGRYAWCLDRRGTNEPRDECGDDGGVREHGRRLRAAKSRPGADIEKMNRRAVGAGNFQRGDAGELPRVAVDAGEPGFACILKWCAETRKKIGHGWTSTSATILLSHRLGGRRMGSENAARVEGLPLKAAEFEVRRSLITRRLGRGLA